MRKEYESPNAYTLSSPFFRQEGMTLTVGGSNKARSGLSPAQYLAPTDKTGGRFRKPAAPTSLDGAMLARYGIRDIAVPVESSRAGSQFLNAKGGLRSRKVQYLAACVTTTPRDSASVLRTLTTIARGLQRVMTVSTAKYCVSRSFHALGVSLIKNDCTGMD